MTYLKQKQFEEKVFSFKPKMTIDPFKENCSIILKHLRKGHEVSNKFVKTAFKIDSLGPIIAELRNKGHEIEYRWNLEPEGGKFKVFFIKDRYHTGLIKEEK